MADLRVDVVDAIATVTLDRPDALNALTVPLKEDLIRTFDALGRDRTVRAIVLTGAGRAFCAGQDLKERLEPDAAPLSRALKPASVLRRSTCHPSSATPTIGVIRG